MVFRSEADAAKLGLGQIGHFTAMVTAKSTKIGCTEVRSEKFRFKVIYTCNYEKRGNLLRQLQNGTIAPIPAYEKLETEGKKKEEKKGKEEVKDKAKESKSEVTEKPKERKKPLFRSTSSRRRKKPKSTRARRRSLIRSASPS